MSPVTSKLASRRMVSKNSGKLHRTCGQGQRRQIVPRPADSRRWRDAFEASLQPCFQAAALIEGRNRRGILKRLTQYGGGEAFVEAVAGKV